MNYPMKTIFRSDRHFFLLSYDAGHGLLLWRSPKSDSARTRCDIMFYDVRAMELRITTESITITEVSLDDLACLQSQPRDLFEPGLIAYNIHGPSWSGFVLAGRVKTAEDDGEIFERSTLAPAVTE